MALFIAADGPLPIVQWNESDPAFNVQAITEDEQTVRRHFTKPHVYYLGAHTGCSCGFSYGQQPVRDEVDKAEDLDGRRSVAHLRQYLRQVLERTQEVELFSAWEGDFEQNAEERFQVTPDWFDGESFRLPERVEYRVTLADSAT